MQEKALSTHALSLLNLKRKPFRTAALMAVVAVLAFVLFGGSIMTKSMEKGIEGLEDRLGADIVVVPEGYDQDFEGVMIQGEPVYFFMDKDILEKVRSCEAVELASPQFYLASLNAECCGSSVPIIGFEPETDFTVQPWITEQYSKGLGYGEIIIGDDINVEADGTILFFGKNYKVAARLERTGSGVDVSCFATMDTIADLYRDAKEKGAYFQEGVTYENSISSIMVKVKEGYTLNQALVQIRKATEGKVEIVQTQSMINSVGGSLSGVVSYLYVIAIVFWVLAVVLLAIVFSVTANERKKEFALFRILGATRKRLSNLILTEAFYVSLSGGIIGIVAAALIVFPFSTYLGDQMGIPYLQPENGTVLIILVVSLVLSAIVGPLASAYSAHKISQAETYHTMREGE
ncbi:MAG: ABC transporter permease [Clostridia bacterium]|nr:ABC transporter permease [Clostridia bacterium]